MVMDRRDHYRDKIEVEFTLEHRLKTLTVKGLMHNNSKKTVHLAELKALYKNFDGFITEVDSLTCDFELPPGGTRTFAFPERAIPVSFSTGEVVVSKVSME